VVASVPYKSVIGLSAARSRQPQWKRADATVADAKLPGGAFGFMKSDRNWLGIQTQQKTYVLRVDDDAMQRVTQSTIDRTGAHLTRLAK
jgi:hypothetical protein